MRFRAEDADAWITVVLEPLTALYHRTSGATHLLAEPAPQILATLAGRALTLAEVRAALGERYYMPDLTDEGLAARLGELVEAGLVAPA